jgi:hypothetical protein
MLGGLNRARCGLAALLLGAGTASIAPGPAAAGPREAGSVRFAERVAVGELTLPLRGVGLLRWKKVVKGYVAGLYVAEGTRPEAVLGDVPKRLELEYFWSIEADAFGAAADRLLSGRLDPETLTSLRPRLDALHRLYRDVEPGDRYALTYVPGRGTELALNGEPLGRVPGADFASAYFGIWLGEDPLDDTLRRKLLAVD